VLKWSVRPQARDFSYMHSTTCSSKLALLNPFQCTSHCSALLHKTFVAVRVCFTLNYTGRTSRNEFSTNCEYDGSPVLTRQDLTVLDRLLHMHSDARYCHCRQRLRSATRHQLNLPRHCCSRFGRRAFSVAGPRAWNLFFAWPSPRSIVQLRLLQISAEDLPLHNAPEHIASQRRSV